MPIYLIVLKKHLETCKTKQIKCPIFWQETVRKLIDGLEILGYLVDCDFVFLNSKKDHSRFITLQIQNQNE